MPLAEERGLIPCRLEVLGKETDGITFRSLIVHDPVMVHVLSGEDRCPAGRAQGGADEGIPQMGPLLGQAVEVWRFEELGCFRHEPQEVEAVIVAKDEDDVAWGVSGPRNARPKPRRDGKN